MPLVWVSVVAFPVLMTIDETHIGPRLAIPGGLVREGAISILSELRNGDGFHIRDSLIQPIGAHGIVLSVLGSLLPLLNGIRCHNLLLHLLWGFDSPC